MIQAAMDALRHWRYEPTLVDGQPIPVELTVTITFRLT
jgi:outer membrane biosynthesis protein TonB